MIDLLHIFLCKHEQPQVLLGPNLVTVRFLTVVRLCVALGICVTYLNPDFTATWWQRSVDVFSMCCIAPGDTGLILWPNM